MRDPQQTPIRNWLVQGDTSNTRGYARRAMRLPCVTLPVAVVLLTGGAARADSFLEVAGGLSIPVGDNAWTNLADTSPKLGARVGAVNDNGLGGMIQADWTP